MTLLSLHISKCHILEITCRGLFVISALHLAVKESNLNSIRVLLTESRINAEVINHK